MNKRIILSGQPKAGNHLLYQVGKFFGSKFPDDFYYWKYRYDIEIPDNMGKQGLAFIAAHAAWSEETEERARSADALMVLIVRDLRDIIASDYRFVSLDPRERLDKFREIVQEVGKEGYINEGISDVRRVGRVLHTAPVRFEKYYFPWMSIDFVLPVRFERLIGSNGGGDDVAQIAEFKKICEFMGSPQTKEWYAKNAPKLWNPKSQTYIPRGGVGIWKQHFSEENVEEFKSTVGADLLVELGYEKDKNWEL